jgi:hypothetical protein
MMNYLSTLIIACVMFGAINLNAQPNADEQKDIAKAFKELNEMFNGGGATAAEIKAKEKKTFEVLNKRFAPKYRKDYPVFFNLCSFMHSCITEKRDSACIRLQQAHSGYANISEKSAQTANNIRNGYLKYFGVPNIEFIEAYYESTYAVDMKIKLGVPCGKTVVISDDALTTDTKTPVPTCILSVDKTQVCENESILVEWETKNATSVLLNGNKVEARGAKKMRVSAKTCFKLEAINDIAKTVDDACVEIQNCSEEDDIIETLRRAIGARNISDFLEITELVKGDGRIVPGVDGVPYEVKLKNAKTKEVIYFDVKQYTIPDRGNIRTDNFRENYDSAMVNFFDLVVYVLNRYGHSAYNIFLQGSADYPTFSPTPLLKGYDSKEYQDISVLKIAEGGVEPVVVHVGPTYINPTLPDLRAAYLKDIMCANSNLKNHCDKVSIIKGNVKVDTNPAKRNCSIVIFIDWNKAKGLASSSGK